MGLQMTTIVRLGSHGLPMYFHRLSLSDRMNNCSLSYHIRRGPMKIYRQCRTLTLTIRHLCRSLTVIFRIPYLRTRTSTLSLASRRIQPHAASYHQRKAQGVRVRRSRKKATYVCNVKGKRSKLYQEENMAVRC